MTDHTKVLEKQSGVDTIQDYAKALPETPGVYRMLNDSEEVLYVGKAKSLKKRVASYTNLAKLPARLQRMVFETDRMEFIHTNTEAEALLLESNLIKKLRPRYNILLRDDKSFPYILLTGDHDFPQVLKHRGAQKRKGAYYGPFAGTGDVNRTIGILQRVFMLRNCSDSYFAHRKRPCLQYHIKRCTAPCVGLVSRESYAAQLKDAKAFLEGKSDAIQEKMAALMQKASTRQDYETAAAYRDRIKALSAVQARQDINFKTMRNADVIALALENGQSCVQVFFFRGGCNYGNRSYFPRHDKHEKPSAILGAFLAQFYENKSAPPNILLSETPDNRSLLEEALSNTSTAKVKISVPQRGENRRAVKFALKNARAVMALHTLQTDTQRQILEDTASTLGMDEPPQRIEVYDNSHISGTDMVGAMIVAGPEGFLKKEYRKFNIKTAAGADDYGMMREVMKRRFKTFATEGQDEPRPGTFPDLLLIDGGKGQLGACCEVLEDYGLLDRLTIIAISKGPDRNAGRESFHMSNGKNFQLPQNTPVLHYMQRLRDEAHRFAITSHRARRQKKIEASPLDNIAGIGAARKKALLNRFGSAKAVTGAGIEDLEQVEGISKALAQRLYDYFH